MNKLSELDTKRNLSIVFIPMLIILGFLVYVSIIDQWGINYQAFEILAFIGLTIEFIWLFMTNEKRNTDSEK